MSDFVYSVLYTTLENDTTPSARLLCHAADYASADYIADVLNIHPGHHFDGTVDAHAFGYHVVMMPKVANASALLQKVKAAHRCIKTSGIVNNVSVSEVFVVPSQNPGMVDCYSVTDFTHTETSTDMLKMKDGYYIRSDASEYPQRCLFNDTTDKLVVIATGYLPVMSVPTTDLWLEVLPNGFTKFDEIRIRQYLTDVWRNIPSPC